MVIANTTLMDHEWSNFPRNNSMSTMMLGGKYYYPQFIDDKTETQKSTGRLENTGSERLGTSLKNLTTGHGEKLVFESRLFGSTIYILSHHTILTLSNMSHIVILFCNLNFSLTETSGILSVCVDVYSSHVNFQSCIVTYNTNAPNFIEPDSD